MRQLFKNIVLLHMLILGIIIEVIYIEEKYVVLDCSLNPKTLKLLNLLNALLNEC
jgi:hypothetical protein